MTHRTLCLSMLATLEKLGNSPTARIDAKVWHRLYARKMARLEKREKEPVFGYPRFHPEDQ